MATTVSTIQSKVNLFIRDTSLNSMSADDRLSAITIAVQELINEFGFDQTNLTYTLPFFNGVYEYNITTDVPYFLEPVSIERELGTGLNDKPFSRLARRDIIHHIDNNIGDKEFSIEHKDENTIVTINLKPRYSGKLFDSCDSLTSNGEWVVDSSTSDATNLTIDNTSYKTGSSSFNFDIDVSQSINNKATIYNETIRPIDYSNDENLSSWIFWADIPDATDVTSYTLNWGTDSSNYWTGSATTDIMGNSLVDGWNRIKIDWSDATKIGSPDASNIGYSSISINYDAGQGDDTDFRIDDIRLIRPEILTFTYNGWRVGSNSSGTDLLAFTATSDIPFYSGQYDFFDNYVAHKAASILFKALRLYEDAQFEDLEAEKEKRKLKNKFPSSRLEESRTFRPSGVKRRIRRTR
jgi:hypothetical protein